MTVIVRRVKTALQREYRKAGGILVSEAVAGAEGNLGELSAAGMEQIDLTLERVSALTANPSRRPTPEELRQIHAAINEMLSFCATVRIEGFAETLHAAARLVGALMEADVWLDGSLTPVANLLRLVRRGAVAPENVGVLILGLDQCAARVRSHARATDTQ